MANKRIYLIRHAQPDYPGGERMCLGQKLDLPLSDEGRRQALCLERFFASVPLECVYSSPLLRAQQTAALLSGGRPVRVLDSLTELSGGEWDGLAFSEIRARYPAYFTQSSRSFSCPPGGETDEQGLARARAALAYVSDHTAACSAMVAHSGINRLLLCTLSGCPMSRKREFPHPYAAVSLLVCRRGIWQVQDVSVQTGLQESGGNA